MENKTNEFGKHACACCGFFTISEIKETCPVCFWEEDFYQENNMNDSGGPNTISLKVAREKFKEIGVMDERFRDQVRGPYKGGARSKN